LKGANDERELEQGYRSDSGRSEGASPLHPTGFQRGSGLRASARQDAESYEDQKTAEFIHENFLPLKPHIKEHPAWFHRFDAVWTPTVLLLDGEGKERARLEGYLPNNDFSAALRNGLGRIAFVHKKYSDAERWYGDVVARYGNSHFAPEAMYRRAVARYKATSDHAVLGRVAEELRNTYPSSLWMSKSIPWLN
jgi:hypothetical protein